MGMWDWLEEQDPAQGSRFGTSGVPPLAASDASALLRLIERGVAARGQTDDDDAGAAQSAREAAAATVARAVKPPYGRDEGWLTQAPEDWVRSMLRGPYSGYPAWPSPANPASPFPPPPSPAASVNAPIDDESAGETQAERAAAVRTVANAARHPYGRMFESVVANNAPTETESARQAQLAREAWAQRLASQGRHPYPPPPPTEAPVETEEMRQRQAALETGAARIANAARPPSGRKMGPLTKYPEYAAEKAGEVIQDALIGWALKKVGGRIFRRRPKP